MHNDRTEMMFDIETLGTRAGCAVLSFAALVYTSTKGTVLGGAGFPLDIPSQIRKGLHVDEGTAAWWATQPDGAWEAATADPVSVTYAVRLLDELVAKHQPERIYCQGMDFDFPIFAEVRRRFGLGAGWEHWKQRDTRTLYEEHGFNPKSMARIGVHHDALDDCQHQIACVIAARGVRAAAPESSK